MKWNFRSKDKKLYDNKLKSAYTLYNYIYRPLKDNPDKDIKCIYFSLEMSAEVLLAKLLCLYIYEEYDQVVSYTDLMSWNTILSDEMYEYANKAKEWLSSISSKLLIYDKGLNSDVFYRDLMENLKQWGTFEESQDGRRKIYIKNNPEQWVWVVVDHLGLCSPKQGSSKKEEIDRISSMAVTLREKCQVSFYMVMQQNRAASDMDRRKAELTELSDEDIKDSGNPYNDCLVCIGIYFPLKYKIKTHKGFPIIVETPNSDFQGLRDRYRAVQLIKNRFGQSDKIVPMNFFGELGIWKELPKAETITDFSWFTNIRSLKEERDSSVPQRTDSKETVTFSF